MHNHIRKGTGKTCRQIAVSKDLRHSRVKNPSGGYVLLQAWTLAFSPTQAEPAPSEDTVY
jgi:hypothetical protein